jgi:autophagy-related protein 18
MHHSHSLSFSSFSLSNSCLALGTRRGYRIYNCQPFAKCFDNEQGGMGLVEMLNTSSLLTMVGRV